MKWQLKLLWVVIILLVVLGIWILSYPFSEEGTESLSFEKGYIDLSKHSFNLSGPISLGGELKFVHKEIVYDDEYIEEYLGSVDYVSASGFLDEDTFGTQTYGTYIFDIVPPQYLSVIAIEIPDISSSYKLWVDGDYIISSGRVDPRETVSEPMTMTKRVFIPVNEKVIRLVLQIANFDHHHTGLQDSLIIGTVEQIMERQINSTLREYLIITTALLIGLYHIAIYAMREDETASLHFGLFSLFLAITLSFYGEKSIYNLYPWMSWDMRVQLGLLFSIVTILLLMRYVILLGEKHSDSRVELGLQLAFAIAYIATSVTFGQLIQVMWINVYISLAFVIVVYSFIQLIYHLKNKEVGMQLAVFGMFVALAIFVYDFSSIYHEKFSSYGLFIFIFSQALALGFRYSEAFKTNVNLTGELRLNTRILEERNSEIERAKVELEKWNRVLDKKVNERTEDIRLLLDHSGQAFLSLNEQSQIQPDYSKLTNVYIGDNIRGVDLWEILYSDSIETASLMRATIERAIHEQSFLRRQSYMAILPDTMNFNGHELDIEYKWIKTDYKEQIMVIMTDVTYEKSLMQQLNNEANENWTTLKIILNSNEFWDLFDEFENFMTIQAYRIIDTSVDFELVKEYLIKKLHYYKGNFSIYGLESIVEGIHNLESELINSSIESLHMIKTILYNSNVFIVLKERLNNMLLTEGVDIYSYRETVLISKSKLNSITSSLKQRYGDEAADLIGDIKTLNHQPFRNLFDSYVDYVSVLGKNIGKQINPLQIIGGEFIIDPLNYEGLSRSMVHVFRNIVDHGIEKPELRYERGKPVAGNIEMKISLNSRGENPFISMRIKDDGAGINEVALRSSVAESLGYDEEKMSLIDRTDMLQFVFSPEITTKTKGDIVSGRGLGMTILKEEILELGGRIRIESEELIGLNIVIEVPYRI